MSEIRPCPQCEANRSVDLVSREESTVMQGKSITFTSVSCRCTHCGDEFDTAETLDISLQNAREQYDRLYKILSRDELIALRAKYNASQKVFGLLLGFGEATINEYEKGSVPDSPHRLLLKLADNAEIFRHIYAENKHKIGKIQRKRIESSPGYSETVDSQTPTQEQWRRFAQQSIVKTAPQDSAEQVCSAPVRFQKETDWIGMGAAS